MSYNLCKTAMHLVKYYIVLRAHIVNVSKDNWCKYI